MYDVQRVYQAESVREALSILAQDGDALVVNGGTDVMIRLKERKLKQASLVSIAGVQALKGICVCENGDIRIGAGACFDDIYRNEDINARIPALAYACNQVGSPQIRHVATIGGNICNGAVSADSVPVLLTLDAKLEIESQSGCKITPLTGFHLAPGKVALDKSAEILKAIVIPAAAYTDYASAYIKFGQRSAMEIATLSCAANIRLAEDRQTVADVRIAFGVAAPTPVRCYKTESALKGRKLDAAFFSLLKRSALDELYPRESWRASKELRVQLIRELSVRAVRRAAEIAGGEVYA